MIVQDVTLIMWRYKLLMEFYGTFPMVYLFLWGFYIKIV